MSKVICPLNECVHNGKNYVCKANKVELKYRNMATVNEGRVDMWVCKQYVLSEEAKRIEEEFKKMEEAIENVHKRMDKGKVGEQRYR